MAADTLTPQIALTDSYNDTLRVFQHKERTFLVQIESEDGDIYSVALTKEQAEQLVTFLTS